MSNRDQQKQTAVPRADDTAIARDEGLPGGLLADALRGEGALRPELKGELLQIVVGGHPKLQAEDLSAADACGESLYAARLEQAVVTLGRLGDGGLDVLSAVSRHALETSDRKLLGDCLRTLAGLSGEVGSVISCLKTYDGPLSARTEALEVLNGLNRPLSALRAVELMHSDDPNLQGDALMALAEIDAGLALEMSRRIALDRSASEILRASAEYVIASVPDGTLPANLQDSAGLTPLKDSVSISLSALHGANPDERVQAMGWLGEHTPQIACCIMADRLRDSAPDVRLYALEGMRRIDGQAALLQAPLLLRDHSPEVSGLAKKILGQ